MAKDMSNMHTDNLVRLLVRSVRRYFKRQGVRDDLQDALASANDEIAFDTLMKAYTSRQWGWNEQQAFGCLFLYRAPPLRIPVAEFVRRIEPVFNASLDQLPKYLVRVLGAKKAVSEVRRLVRTQEPADSVVSYLLYWLPGIKLPDVPKDIILCQENSDRTRDLEFDGLYSSMLAEPSDDERPSRIQFIISLTIAHIRKIINTLRPKR